VEARRLIWLIGMMFAVILMLQYFELPYGNLLSSLFSAAKASVVGNSSFQTGDSPSQSEFIGNMTNLFGSNSHSAYSVHERANSTRTSNGRDRNPKEASVSGKNGGSNHYLGQDEDINAAKDSSPVKLNNISRAADVKSANKGSASEETREPEQRFYQTNYTTDTNFSIHKIEKDDNTSTSEHIESSPLPAVPPLNSSPHVTSPPQADKNATTSFINENSGKLQSDLIPSGNNSSLNRVPKVNKGLELPTSSVVSISEMSGLLLQSRASSHSVVCVSFSFKLC
jgi:hypothetical protein